MYELSLDQTSKRVGESLLAAKIRRSIYKSKSQKKSLILCIFSSLASGQNVPHLVLDFLDQMRLLQNSDNFNLNSECYYRHLILSIAARLTISRLNEVKSFSAQKAFPRSENSFAKKY